jgi:hypothetical protein
MPISDIFTFGVAVGIPFQGSRNAQAVASEFPKSCEIAKQLIAKYSSL